MLETLPANAASFTAALCDDLLGIEWDALTPEAVRVAKQCLLDWLGVSIAGREEPLVRILADEFADEEQPRGCSIIGDARRVSMEHAALINGAMGHALDFDDVIHGMGHPTVPVAPAVFALSETIGASGRDLLLAFITGVDAECRVARYMGLSHYLDGWHSTATLGTFGAAAGAARLWGLDREQLQHAFGIAGTQAAGLVSVFGTMTKPLHPGKSAVNGLLAARLARRGFTSDTNILGSAHGFGATQSRKIDPSALTSANARGFHVVDALFKYHAACYLTHDTIEASNILRQGSGVSPDAIAAVRLRVRPVHLGICNIAEPRTGLECKFSLRMTAAMALSGEDTFSDALYTDETANRPDLVALRRKVTVEPTSDFRGSHVEVQLNDGRRLEQSFDVAEPMRDLDAQQHKLERKFRALTERLLGAARVDEIIERVTRLDDALEVTSLLAACRPG